MALWISGTAVPEDRPVYVRSVDVIALLEKLSDKGSPCPRILIVQPNGEAALPLLEFLENLDIAQATNWLEYAPQEAAKAKIRWEGRDPLFEGSGRITRLDQLRAASLEKAEAEIRPLIRAARDVVISLHACSAAALIQAAEALESTARIQQFIALERCHPLTTSLAIYLQAVGEELIQPMEQGLLYCHEDNNAHRRDWWHTQPYLSQVCIELQRKVQIIGAPEPPLVVQKMNDWLKAVGIQIDRMSLTKAGEHHVVFETASAWFTAAGLRHIERAHAGWGLLFLHRAVEWLLMAKSAEMGFIDFTKVGGRYKINHVAKGAKPSFNNHLTALAGYVNFFELEELFKEINQWRNLLPYTHHMTVAPDDKAYFLLSKIVEGLPKFASSTHWSNAVKTFAKAPPINLEDLVDPDGLLRSSITMAE